MLVQGKRIDKEVIKTTSEKTNLPEDWVELINNFQFKLVSEGCTKYKSVEITGFGTLKVKASIVEKKIKRKDDQINIAKDKLANATSDKDIKRMNKIVSTKVETKKYLESKL